MDLVVGAKDEFNQKLAEFLGAGFVELEKHVFPDKELRPRVRGSVEDFKGKKVLLVNRSLAEKNFQPNTALMETFFTIKNLKSLGAAKVHVLLPYFFYGMQDKVFRKGEPHSALYVLQLLKSSGADSLFVVCSHMQRTQGELAFAKGIIKAHTISVWKDVAGFLKKNYELKNPIVIGPDFTSNKNAEEVAKLMGASDSTAIHKKRDLNTYETTIQEEDLKELKGRDVVIVDDIAETGGTMAKAIDLCKKRGAGKIVCAVVHPVLAGDCLERIGSKTSEFIATNTIQSKISKISVEETLAEYVKNNE
jgi:ribose-phosphate pyrophosphokinase